MLEKIKEYTERAYATACKHGFHDEELSTEHLLMLVITEVSEMVEADRKNKHSIDEKAFTLLSQPFKGAFELYVKDSVGDEMADVCVRLFDLLGVSNKEEELDFDLLKAIITSKKRRIKCEGRLFTELAFTLCDILTDVEVVPLIVCHALAFVECWAEDLGIDLDYHIQMKMRYNELRKNKHGKKY